MKFHIALAIVFGLLLVAVSTAPQTDQKREEPSEQQTNRESTDTTPPDTEQPTQIKPSEVLNQFATIVGEVIQSPAVLVALAFYPLACAIREGGCRSNENFDGTLNFNLTPLNGDIDQLKKQFKSDGDVDVTENNEFTPLVDAFAQGKAKVVKLFLQNGGKAENGTLKDDEKVLKILLKADAKEKTNEVTR